MCDLVGLLEEEDRDVTQAMKLAVAQAALDLPTMNMRFSSIVVSGNDPEETLQKGKLDWYKTINEMFSIFDRK